ncbi:MAG: hypothetical protein ABL893_11110 [Hyphomicrobium sp.]
MGTRTILEIALDVASETGLQRPVSLFGFAEGDETAVQLRRAITWTCRYLARHFAFKEYTAGSIGKTTAGVPLGMAFAADTDAAWPPDEIVHLGTLWRMEHGDLIEDPTDARDFDKAVTEWIWTQSASPNGYRTLDAGMPQRMPIGSNGDMAGSNDEIEWV